MIDTILDILNPSRIDMREYEKAIEKKIRVESNPLIEEIWYVKNNKKIEVPLQTKLKKGKDYSEEELKIIEEEVLTSKLKNSDIYNDDELFYIPFKVDYIEGGIKTLILERTNLYSKEKIEKVALYNPKKALTGPEVRGNLEEVIANKKTITNFLELSCLGVIDKNLDFTPQAIYRRKPIGVFYFQKDLPKKQNFN